QARSASEGTPHPSPAAAEAGVIPLPPVSQPAPAKPRSRRRLAGPVLVLLVLLLALLSGSFLARNSDLWFHLGTGRLLAEGQFSFGADPFAYTTSGAYWACHTWLFDLALYDLHRLVGETGLVVLKALLISGLAGLLLLVRRRDVSVEAPVVCTALAVL